MKVIYSNSLMLVWQIADLEAKNLHAAFLESPHLLLGLCKSVDVDVTGLAQAGNAGGGKLVDELQHDLHQLRSVFSAAGLDPMRFRRYYRTVLPEGSAGLVPAVARLHRNDAAKDVFLEAEKIATPSGNVVYPIHLLYSLLSEPDSQRERAIAAVGASEARLRQIVRNQLSENNQSTPLPTSQSNPQWN